ncbi:MAG: holo-ACP synthase [Acidimicrobiia bacterium]|nr:holo-ACP synthase [Acidimicrobiia bacterium]
MRGVGTDLVEIPRFRAALDRRPALATRLFSDAERAHAAKFADPVPRLAARFSAKEAVMKALGVGLGGIDLHDVEVASLASGRPELVVRGRAADLAADRAVTGWHLSLTHTESMAMAVVIAVGTDA